MQSQEKTRTRKKKRTKKGKREKKSGREKKENEKEKKTQKKWHKNVKRSRASATGFRLPDRATVIEFDSLLFANFDTRFQLTATSRGSPGVSSAHHLDQILVELV